MRREWELKPQPRKCIYKDIFDTVLLSQIPWNLSEANTYHNEKLTLVDKVTKGDKKM